MEWLIDVMLRALTYAAPIGLAALGEMLVERTGMVNLGVEGMMALGAAAAAMTAALLGDPAIGLVAAAAAGAILALVFHVLASIGADQIVVGLALVFLGVGLGEIIGVRVEAPAPPIQPLWRLIGPLELALPILAILSYIMLYHTWLGYSLRSIGENTEAARALGVPIHLYRLTAVAIGGVLAGAAGGYLTLYMFQGKWFSGVTMGWGWIAIGTVILGYWHPILIALAAYIIGLLFVLEPIVIGYGVPVEFAHALPYVAVIAALAVVTYAARRRGLKPPIQVWVEALT